jgi:hypothetical protein
MIIFDYNAIALGSIMANKNLEQDLVRHMILNTLRMYRQKFPKKDYGDVILACDAPNNWRREVFPQYKANRRKNRSESDFNWDEAFRILNETREEIRVNFPYKLIQVDGCEADDVIGTLAYNTQEFGQYENVVIISADHDFAQLQVLDNVKQFSPIAKKFVVEKNPRLKLLNHIFKGDPGDGVPNVLSDDNVFVEGIRQTPLSQKKMDGMITDLNDGELLYAASWYRNYQRNQRLVDLQYTPEHLKAKILEEFQKPPQGKGSLILPYLINKKCKLLIEVASEFS